MPRIPPLSALCLALGLALGGCAQFPELDAAVSADAKAAPYPRLAPIGGLLARAAAPAPEPEAVSGGLAARSDALRARADRLRGAPVVDAPTRGRMDEAVGRHSG